MVLHGSLVIFLETVDIDDYLLFFRLSSNFFDTILSFYLFELFSVYLIHSLSRFHSLNMDALQGLLLKCHTAKQSLSCACRFIGSENKTCPRPKRCMAQWGNGSCSVYKVKFKILASAQGSPKMDLFQAKSPYLLFCKNDFVYAVGFLFAQMDAWSCASCVSGVSFVCPGDHSKQVVRKTKDL